VRERRGRRRAKLLDYLKEKRGCWKLKEEAVDRTVGRTGIGRRFGTVVRYVDCGLMMIVSCYIRIIDALRSQQ
jgi:hypothetical protein